MALKNPKYNFYAEVEPCTNEGCWCRLYFAQVRDPMTGGWWTGQALTPLKALEDAIIRAKWAEYRPACKK